MAVIWWILVAMILAVSLLLLSVFEGKRDLLRDAIVFPEGSLTAAVSEALLPPHERLKTCEGKLTTKSHRLEISQEKIDETKKTISELELTSGEVQQKYRQLLSQLKSELNKTESECKNLHYEIANITTKRDKLREEMLEHQARIPKLNSFIADHAESQVVDDSETEQVCPQDHHSETSVFVRRVANTRPSWRSVAQ